MWYRLGRVPSRFSPIRRLGSGGATEVILAEDGGAARRRVVVKRVLPHLAGDHRFLDAFRAQAAVALRLHHPNVVRTFEAGEEEGLPFLVMEALDGVDLRAIAGPVAPGVACAIAAAVARGLAYAHGFGDRTGPLLLVHRDVTPHNIFLTRAGAVKVLDFDNAKSTCDAKAAGRTTVVGKIGYMAPEQLAGLAIDARADLFALGVVLWEMLTGRRPWGDRDGDGVAQATREESVLPPSAVAAGVPCELDGLVMALLAKFPTGRPAHARDVAAWLDTFLASCGAPDAAASIASAVDAAVARARPK